jgi:CheY-like chemotaxis protein
MPRESGVDLMRWLRTEGDGPTGPPAIAVTGYPREFLKQRDVAHAFDAYFEKPIDAPRFLGMVEVMLLKQQRQIP